MSDKHDGAPESMADSDHDYKRGGWKDKYVIFGDGGPCPSCAGDGVRRRGFFAMRWETCRSCHGTGRTLLRKVGRRAYFVLRYDADPHARAAMLAYADSVDVDNAQFAKDIRKRLAQMQAAKATP